VIYNAQFDAEVLVECKAPEIKLTHEVFMQISTYQQKLGANFLILSNGDTHLVYGIDTNEKQLLLMEHFPKHN
jgi:hypothetical protein